MAEVTNFSLPFRSACEGGGSCVEVATIAKLVLVRDSKDPDSPVLAFTQAEWQQFVAGVRRGELDFG
jgi:predicted secreted Zn-dependent protease